MTTPGSQTENPRVEMCAKIPAAISSGLHRIAQPLTVLQGLLDLTLAEESGAAEYRKCLEQVLSEASRAIQYLNETREATGLVKPSTDIESFSASACIHAVLRQMGGAAILPQATCDSENAGPDDVIRVSRSRFSRALDLIFSSIPSPSKTALVSSERRGDRLTILAEFPDAVLEPTTMADARNNLATADVILASIEGELEVDWSAVSVTIRICAAHKPIQERW